MAAPRLGTSTTRLVQTTIFLISTAFLNATTLAQTAPSAERGPDRLRELYFQRDYDAAVALGKELAAAFPDDFELRAWYALNLARNDDQDEAVAEAEAMVAADSSSAWAWFGLAAALNWHDERGEEALAASEKALELSPDDVYFVWLRTDVLRAQESEESAVTYADQLPLGFRDHPLILVRKATAMHFQAQELEEKEESKAKTEEAYTVFAQARAADPTNVEAHFLPGTYLLNEGRTDEAHELLARAAQLTPAVRVHEYYWRSVQGNRELSKEQKRAEIDADVTTLLADCADEPSTLRSAARIYGEIDLLEKKKALEEYLLERYPDGPDAEWLLYARFIDFRQEMWSEARDRDGDPDSVKRARYRRMVTDFINRPHHHEDRLLGQAYMSLFSEVKDDHDFDDDSLYAVIENMVKYENPNLHIVYAQAAVALADRGIYLEEATEIARDGIEATEEQYEEHRENNVFRSEEDLQRGLNYTLATMYDALGWVYFHQARPDEAAEELLRSHDLWDENVENLQHLGKFYEQRRKAALSEDGAGEAAAAEHLDRAEEFYIKGAMTQTFRDNPNEESLERLYEKRHGDLEGYDEYLASLEETYRELRRERILSERIEEPESLPAFTLETLAESKTFSSDQLTGKVAVINHWGTWCGPCVIEMPELQEFHEKYRDDPDVVVITIDYNDAVEDVQEWMAKYEYDFVVLLDDGYVRDAGVRAWPTTWFVDRDGKIVFEKVGASAALAEEFGWRVEALRNP